MLPLELYTHILNFGQVNLNAVYASKDFLYAFLNSRWVKDLPNNKLSTVKSIFNPHMNEIKYVHPFYIMYHAIKTRNNKLFWNVYNNSYTFNELSLLHKYVKLHNPRRDIRRLFKFKIKHPSTPDEYDDWYHPTIVDNGIDTVEILDFDNINLDTILSIFTWHRWDLWSQICKKYTMTELTKICRPDIEGFRYICTAWMSVYSLPIVWQLNPLLIRKNTSKEITYNYEGYIPDFYYDFCKSMCIIPKLKEFNIDLFNSLEHRPEFIDYVNSCELSIFSGTSDTNTPYAYTMFDDSCISVPQTYYLSTNMDKILQTIELYTDRQYYYGPHIPGNYITSRRPSNISGLDIQSQRMNHYWMLLYEYETRYYNTSMQLLENILKSVHYDVYCVKIKTSSSYYTSQEYKPIFGLCDILDFSTLTDDQIIEKAIEKYGSVLGKRLLAKYCIKMYHHSIFTKVIQRVLTILDKLYPTIIPSEDADCLLIDLAQLINTQAFGYDQEDGDMYYYDKNKFETVTSLYNKLTSESMSKLLPIILATYHIDQINHTDNLFTYCLNRGDITINREYFEIYYGAINRVGLHFMSQLLGSEAATNLLTWLKSKNHIESDFLTYMKTL